MWYIAIILGLAGSLHCIGMCSPLMVAATSIKGKAFYNRIFYNTGRILTYGLVGALVATTGLASGISQVQFMLTLVAGLLMIMMGIAGTTGVHLPFITSIMNRFTGKIKTLFGTYLHRKTSASLFITGMLNGLLPCGLTYFALTYCLTLQGPLDGFFFMLLFGIATLPALLGVTAVFAFVIRKTGWELARLSRYTLLFAGALVLARLLFTHQTVIKNASHQVIMLCQ